MLTLLVSSLAVLSQLNLEDGGVVLPRSAGAVRVEPGCTAVGAVELDLLYVGCRDGRVRSFRLSPDQPPALVDDVPVEGELVGLFVANGRVWVELVRREARPLSPRLVSREPLPQVASAGEGTSSGETARSSPAAPAETTPTEPISGSLFFPERAGAYVSLSVGVGLVVPLGFSGIGMLTDLSAAWHASVPFALRARLSPAGGLFGSQAPNQYRPTMPGGVWNFAVEALFDGRFFGVGLGVGAGQTIQYSQRPSGMVGEPGAGFTLVQVLRIGALDGLHAEGRTTLVSLPVGFGFLGGEGRVGVPFRAGWQLLVGGGGLQATAWGEVAMRIRLPTESQLFITPKAGFTSVQGFAGPSVGVSLDVRL